MWWLSALDHSGDCPPCWGRVSHEVVWLDSPQRARTKVDIDVRSFGPLGLGASISTSIALPAAGIVGHATRPCPCRKCWSWPVGAQRNEVTRGRCGCPVRWDHGVASPS
jgi:hypothetical protein